MRVDTHKSLAEEHTYPGVSRIELNDPRVPGIQQLLLVRDLRVEVWERSKDVHWGDGGSNPVMRVVVERETRVSGTLVPDEPCCVTVPKHPAKEDPPVISDVHITSSLSVTHEGKIKTTLTLERDPYGQRDGTRHTIHFTSIAELEEAKEQLELRLKQARAMKYAAEDALVGQQ